LTTKTWTFNITEIIDDAADPLVKIVYPINNTILEPGSTITVTFHASDIGDSGLRTLLSMSGAAMVSCIKKFMKLFQNILSE